MSQYFSEVYFFLCLRNLIYLCLVSVAVILKRSRYPTQKHAQESLSSDTENNAPRTREVPANKSRRRILISTPAKPLSANLPKNSVTIQGTVGYSKHVVAG